MSFLCARILDALFYTYAGWYDYQHIYITCSKNERERERDPGLLLNVYYIVRRGRLFSGWVQISGACCCLCVLFFFFFSFSLSFYKVLSRHFFLQTGPQPKWECVGDTLVSFFFIFKKVPGRARATSFKKLSSSSFLVDPVSK